MEEFILIANVCLASGDITRHSRRWRREDSCGVPCRCDSESCSCRSIPSTSLLKWATRLDAAGVDSLWMVENLALAQDVDHPWYAGWDLLAAMAVVTERCRIGPLVTTFQYHFSLAMARHVVTVDSAAAGAGNLRTVAPQAVLPRVARSTALLCRLKKHP